MCDNRVKLARVTDKKDTVCGEKVGEGTSCIKDSHNHSSASDDISMPEFSNYYERQKSTFSTQFLNFER